MKITSRVATSRNDQLHIDDQRVTILPPQDAFATLRAQTQSVTVAMLDPWYNKGVGGERDDYDEWLRELLHEASRIADHVYLWGFPEIVCAALRPIPPGMKFVAWITWYFKNCPSVIRGWRSAQMACLHFSKLDARMYPEHFLNEAQLEKQRQGKLRYMPGPPSVIEVPLNIGFVGKREQTGHPSQKPEAVYEQLLRMVTVPGDSILDPMCGSGTSGVVARKLGLKALLCDGSDEYTKMVENRLGLRRVSRRRTA